MDEQTAAAATDRTAEEDAVSTAPADEDGRFSGWAVLEIMGHVRWLGYVADVEIFGTRMVRVEPLGDDGEKMGPRYYGASSIYGLTPCSEEEIRGEITRRRAQAERRAILMAPRNATVTEETAGDSSGDGDEGDEDDGDDTWEFGGEDEEEDPATVHYPLSETRRRGR